MYSYPTGESLDGLITHTIPRHYVTCTTPGTINPRRAYDWRARSDADYLRAIVHVPTS